jgi:23S rRNA pseudouridine1911/1915/1917 synthase
MGASPLKSATVHPCLESIRLDDFLHQHQKHLSMATIRRSIAKGEVQVNGKHRTSGWRLSPGDTVACNFNIHLSFPLKITPIHLTFIYQDFYFLAVNKPPAMLSHPSVKERDGTLINALLAHPAFAAPDAPPGNRPILMHRLDRDTSGVIVVAKNNHAAKKIFPLFNERKIEKTYCALVVGVPDPDVGEVRAPIGRHPALWPRWRIMDDGKPSHSTYRVLKKFVGCSLVELRPVTGRTHQLRIHMAHIGHPILGDHVYGNQPNKRFESEFPDLKAPRQMLHAARIAFTHPFTKQPVSVEAPLPDDITLLINALSSL